MDKWSLENTQRRDLVGREKGSQFRMTSDGDNVKGFPSVQCSSLHVVNLSKGWRARGGVPARYLVVRTTRCAELLLMQAKRGWPDKVVVARVYRA